MSKCILGVTIEVSDKAYEVLSTIKEQHTLVNMLVNHDGTVTISQTVEDEEDDIWQGYIWSDGELADTWEELSVVSSKKFPF